MVPFYFEQIILQIEISEKCKYNVHITSFCFPLGKYLGKSSFLFEQQNIFVIQMMFTCLHRHPFKPPRTPSPKLLKNRYFVLNYNTKQTNDTCIYYNMFDKLHYYTEIISYIFFFNYQFRCNCKMKWDKISLILSIFTKYSNDVYN